MKKLIIYILLSISFSSFSQNYTLEGFVYKIDAKTQLVGANVQVVETNQISFTNKEGFFSFKLKPGNYTLKVSFLGYSTYEQKIPIFSNDTLVIYLKQEAQELSEVRIVDNRLQRVLDNPQTGMLRLSMQEIKKLPAFLGENDPIRAIKLMPGVQAGGEGNAGIFVRGSDPGQNLIILEDMPIYNASHLLGLYSVFNPVIVKNVSLYKGAYPAMHGGRASSLMKIWLYDQIPDKTKVEGNIGFLSSNISVCKPIFKGNGSITLGGRTTYMQLIQSIFKTLNIFNKTLENNIYNFNDINLRLETRLNTKNRIILNYYLGTDNYKSIYAPIQFENQMNWGNQAATAKWLHAFNSNLTWSNIIGYSEYFFNLNAGYRQYGIILKARISDPFLRSEFAFTKGKHFIQTGIESVLHVCTPESVKVTIDETKNKSNLYFRSYEGNLYLNDNYAINSKISIVMGIRNSFYAQLGPYNKYLTNSQGFPVDTINYGFNKIVQKYNGIEPRFSMIYKYSENNSLKASLSRNYQFIHLISVGSVSLPTDIWFPSTLHVKPEYTDQFSAGYFKTFFNNNYEASAELYYKKLNRVIEFKNSLITNYRYNEFEKSITHGVGYSFGTELFISKKTGDFTGWLTYTLAWSLRKFKDLNNGKIFFGKYDRRHEIAVTLQYQVNKDWNISSVFIYSTGNAMTLPSGRYMIQGKIVNDYTSVNSFRMPPYHRMDLSATYTRKINEKFETSWNLSVYNVYNRANPYYILFDIDGNLDEYYLSVKAQKRSLFPILPAISWKFKF